MLTGSLLWETGTLSMGLRVWREKLCLALHIVRMDSDTLANRIWREQCLYQWPGLSEETVTICKELEIEHVTDTDVTAKVYRKKVTEACHRLNERRLRKMMLGKRKCTKIHAEYYGQKSYFDQKIPNQVGDQFTMRLEMLPIAGNFTKDNIFRLTGWLCLCGEREEQEHIRSHCQEYADIRAQYDDLDSDEQLVLFFREVLARRDRLREEEKMNENILNPK